MLKEKIEEIVNKLDPIGIMPYCPKDEYKSEISSIYKLIITLNDDKINEDIIADIIVGVFYESIDTSININMSEINKSSKEIYSYIKNEKDNN